jgi:hypothetical protein
MVRARHIDDPIDVIVKALGLSQSLSVEQYVSHSRLLDQSARVSLIIQGVCCDEMRAEASQQRVCVDVLMNRNRDVRHIH